MLGHYRIVRSGLHTSECSTRPCALEDGVFITTFTSGGGSHPSLRRTRPSSCVIIDDGEETKVHDGESASPGNTIDRYGDENVHSDVSIDSTQSPLTCDDDGDIIVQRKNVPSFQANQCEIVVYHTLQSTLDLCGLQVWRGALLMCDYLLSPSAQRAYDGCVGLELGSGCGMGGVALARVAHSVFLSDVCTDVLKSCERTIGANRHAFKYESDEHSVCCVRRMDVTRVSSTCPIGSAGDAFDITSADVPLMMNTDVILCADCIYDPDLTEGLMNAIGLFLHPPGSGKHALVSVEKRIVFTDRICAPAYDHWRELFFTSHHHHHGDEEEDDDDGDDGDDDDRGGVGEMMEHARLVGRRISHVPHTLSYDRTDQLELWKMWMEWC